MRITMAGASDPGLLRDANQDSLLLAPQYDLCVVADGLGTGVTGVIASQLVTSTFSELFFKTRDVDSTWPFTFDPELPDEANKITTSIRLANRQLCEMRIRSPDLVSAGTTVVAAIFLARRKAMCIAHVGDSRAYLVRGGHIRQLTMDHSLLNDAPAAVPDVADRQLEESQRSVLTRCIGVQDTVSVDLEIHEANDGDTFLLCTGGLTNQVEDDAILDVLLHHRALSDATRALIQLALANGGEDNVTVALVRVQGDSAARANEAARVGAGTGKRPGTPQSDYKIFVSYRRADSADVTGRIVDRLAAHFSPRAIFHDVGAIPLGEDFQEHLRAAVTRCAVVLVVIGRAWDEPRESSLAESTRSELDFVRFEIATALARDIPVVPVLVHGASMPAEKELPADIARLARRNGTVVRPDPDFAADMDRLIRALAVHVEVVGPNP